MASISEVKNIAQHMYGSRLVNDEDTSNWQWLCKAVVDLVSIVEEQDRKIRHLQLNAAPHTH